MTKTQKPTLILASASPRRKEILEAHGHSFEIIPSDEAETIPEDMRLTPEETTIYLAKLKADSVFSAINPDKYPGGFTVLGVDTIVYKDRIFGKPADEEDALNILRSLKNTTHKVISGVCLITSVPRYEKITFSDTTLVTFGDYTDEEIRTYVRANPPYDKSGSYAIQSDWGRNVLSITGDIENVIGLPYQKLSVYLL